MKATLFTVLIVVILLIVFALLFTRLITRSIDQTVIAVERFLKEKPTNLRSIAAASTQDEANKIGAYFKEFIEELRKDIKDVARVEKNTADLKQQFATPLTGIFAVFNELDEQLPNVKTQIEKTRDAADDAVGHLSLAQSSLDHEAIKDLKHAKYSIVELSLKISALQSQFEQAFKCVKQIDVNASSSLATLSKITKKYLW